MKKESYRIKVAVVGASSCDSETALMAEEVGELIARRGAILINGGLGGVMEASARGAKAAGGLTVGILPGFDPLEANDHIDVTVATGMSIARNAIIVRSADVVLAVAGGYGTLSEIAMALNIGKPVVGLRTWEGVPGIIRADTPKEAVDKVFELL